MRMIHDNYSFQIVFVKSEYQVIVNIITEIMIYKP